MFLVPSSGFSVPGQQYSTPTPLPHRPDWNNKQWIDYFKVNHPNFFLLKQIQENPDHPYANRGGLTYHKDVVDPGTPRKQFRPALTPRPQTNNYDQGVNGHLFGHRQQQSNPILSAEYKSSPKSDLINYLMRKKGNKGKLPDKSKKTSHRTKPSVTLMPRLTELKPKLSLAMDPVSLLFKNREKDLRWDSSKFVVGPQPPFSTTIKQGTQEETETTQSPIYETQNKTEPGEISSMEPFTAESISSTTENEITTILPEPTSKWKFVDFKAEIISEMPSQPLLISDSNSIPAGDDLKQTSDEEEEPITATDNPCQGLTSGCLSLPPDIKETNRNELIDRSPLEPLRGVTELEAESMSLNQRKGDGKFPLKLPNLLAESGEAFSFMVQPKNSPNEALSALATPTAVTKSSPSPVPQQSPEGYFPVIRKVPLPPGTKFHTDSNYIKNLYLQVPSALTTERSVVPKIDYVVKPTTSLGTTYVSSPTHLTTEYLYSPSLKSKVKLPSSPSPPPLPPPSYLDRPVAAEIELDTAETNLKPFLFDNLRRRPYPGTIYANKHYAESISLHEPDHSLAPIHTPTRRNQYIAIDEDIGLQPLRQPVVIPKLNTDYLSSLALQVPAALKDQMAIRPVFRDRPQVADVPIRVREEFFEATTIPTIDADLINEGSQGDKKKKRKKNKKKKKKANKKKKKNQSQKNQPQTPSASEVLALRVSQPVPITEQVAEPYQTVPEPEDDTLNFISDLNTNVSPGDSSSITAFASRNKPIPVLPMPALLKEAGEEFTRPVVPKPKTTGETPVGFPIKTRSQIVEEQNILSATIATPSGGNNSSSSSLVTDRNREIDKNVDFDATLPTASAGEIAMDSDSDEAVVISDRNAATIPVSNSSSSSNRNSNSGSNMVRDSSNTNAMIKDRIPLQDQLNRVASSSSFGSGFTIPAHLIPLGPDGVPLVRPNGSVIRMRTTPVPIRQPEVSVP